MSDLSDERLQELEALRAKATQGEWEGDGEGMFIFSGSSMVADYDGPVARIRGFGAGLPQSDNLALIVAAVNALPDLISELQRRREEEGWIPVTERLPEPDALVLLATDDGYVVATLDKEDGWVLPEDVDGVTHWHSLPGVPNGE